MKITREISNKKAEQMERNGECVRTGTLVNMLISDRNRRNKMADQNAADAINETIDNLEEAKTRVLEAVNKLVKAEDEVAERSRKAIARTKDVANQLADQLNRVNKMLGPDFEIRLSQLERMAAALDTLSRIEKEGKLQSIIAAISR